ncbi:MAG TPA: alpha/beta hydrolase [Stellaceae bacterium]|jgi:pimeloyl-ACP methyl ester carboxylesterase|nr:alpha/beta hydrolase [Stellaceae bacterium]
MAKNIPGPLYCEEIGATGVPMMFLHSTPDDHRLWMFQTAHFSSDYRCLAVDCAGYGRSPAVQPGVTIDDHADACWEIIDRHTKGAAIIHGNSFGSEVAMHMAQRQPERVAALILSGCGYVATSEIFSRWAQRYRDEGLPLRHAQVLDHFAPEGQKSKLLNHYAAMVCALNNTGTLDSIVANNEALARRPDASFYDGITSPTIIIIGDLDRTKPASFELQKRIKGSELVFIPDVGHACNIEAPAAYDAACIRFLRKHGLYHGAAKEG